MCKASRMESFSDFCKWAGSQRKAAELLGVSESTVSRMASGDVSVSKETAERIEAVSGGLFRKERVLWPEGKAA